MDYIVVSYYSKGNEYEYYARNLRDNLDTLSIPYDIEGIEFERKQRRFKVLHKPKFIKKMMDKHDKTVIWCDCDDGFRNSPDKVMKNLRNDFDVGVLKSNISGIKYTGGIHIWNNTKLARKKLDIWNYLCSWPEISEYNDHKRLIWALTCIKEKDKRNEARVRDLIGQFKDIWKVEYNKSKKKLW